jgi:hypothetical protein
VSRALLSCGITMVITNLLIYWGMGQSLKFHGRVQLSLVAIGVLCALVELVRQLRERRAEKGKVGRP